MGWFEDILNVVTGIATSDVWTQSTSDIVEKVATPSAPVGDTSDPTKKPFSFLTLTALLLGTAAFAPAAYVAYNKSKRKSKRSKKITEDPMFLALEGGSNRATSLLAGIMPAFALPVAYIGIEELEQRQIISGPLGDDVQGLMTAGVVAPAIGNVIGSVLGAAVKGKK